VVCLLLNIIHSHGSINALDGRRLNATSTRGKCVPHLFCQPRFFVMLESSSPSVRGVHEAILFIIGSLHRLLELEVLKKMTIIVCCTLHLPYPLHQYVDKRSCRSLQSVRNASDTKTAVHLDRENEHVERQRHTSIDRSGSTLVLPPSCTCCVLSFIILIAITIIDAHHQYDITSSDTRPVHAVERHGRLIYHRRCPPACRSCWFIDRAFLRHSGSRVGYKANANLNSTTEAITRGGGRSERHEHNRSTSHHRNSSTLYDLQPYLA
jgi:hypothetical protein